MCYMIAASGIYMCMVSKCIYLLSHARLDLCLWNEHIRSFSLDVLNIKECLHLRKVPEQNCRRFWLSRRSQVSIPFLKVSSAPDWVSQILSITIRSSPSSNPPDHFWRCLGRCTLSKPGWPSWETFLELGLKRLFHPWSSHFLELFLF